MAKDDSNAWPLQDVMNLVIESCHLQRMGTDVAIPYIVGPPGGGKTKSIEAAAKSCDWLLDSCHFAMKPLEEIGGDACVYVDQMDSEDIARGISEIMQNDELKMMNIKKGLERVKEFSWEKCARETLHHLNT